jgi:poly(3-hydroxybutyrate) depolymerase
LRFAPVAPSWSTRQGWGAWNVMNVGEVPTFMDIDDVDFVYRLVSDLREKTRGAASNTSVNNW